MHNYTHLNIESVTSSIKILFFPTVNSNKKLSFSQIRNHPSRMFLTNFRSSLESLPLLDTGHLFSVYCLKKYVFAFLPSETHALNIWVFTSCSVTNKLKNQKLVFQHRKGGSLKRQWVLEIPFCFFSNSPSCKTWGPQELFAFNRIVLNADTVNIGTDHTTNTSDVWSLRCTSSISYALSLSSHPTTSKNNSWSFSTHSCILPMTDTLIPSSVVYAMYIMIYLS